jgi:nitrilase
MNLARPGAAGDRLTIAMAQVAPVLLDRAATLARVVTAVDESAAAGAQLVAFGEALVPGYPFWLEHLDGARFEDPAQKRLHARYLDQAVQVERGDLAPVQEAARRHGLMIQLGIIERPGGRGGHSLFASLVTIGTDGAVLGVHRKLQPTHEERLAWTPGDGHGLRTHPLGAFTVGGLNCWENWMPLPRAALYAQGEDLHVACWPGSERNTAEITRFLAREGRSYVGSVSGLLHADDLPTHVAELAPLREVARGWLADGGSCIANPDATWLAPPLVGTAGVVLGTLDHARIREERQNFDPAGHYARPDVTRVHVDRRRPSTLETDD